LCEWHSCGARQELACLGTLLFTVSSLYNYVSP
jgi:hypothetical protein